MVNPKKQKGQKFSLPFETVGFLGDANWRDTFGSASGTATPSQVSGQSSRTRTPRNLEEAMAKLYGNVEANRQRVEAQYQPEEQYSKIPYTSAQDPGAVLFYRKYMRLTEKETNTHALTDTIRSLREYKLHQNLDNLTREYLRPLIGAIKRSKELVGIRLACEAEKKELKRVAGVMKRSGLSKPNRNLIERSKAKMEQIRERTEIQRRDPSVALARSLATSFKVTQVLERVELHGIPFTYVGVESLAEGFSHNECIQHFSLMDCAIGDRNLVPLLNIFMSHRLPTSLCLAGNNLTDATGIVLARIIRKWVSRRAINEWEHSLRGRDRSEGSKGLRVLDLSQNDLTDDSLEQLSRAWFHDIWLKELDLRRNRFSKRGGRALCDMLFENRSLLSVKVSGNRFGTAILEEIKKAIARNEAEAKEQMSLRSAMKHSTVSYQYAADLPDPQHHDDSSSIWASEPPSARRPVFDEAAGIRQSVKDSFGKYDQALRIRTGKAKGKGNGKNRTLSRAEADEAELRLAANFDGTYDVAAHRMASHKADRPGSAPTRRPGEGRSAKDYEVGTRPVDSLDDHLPIHEQRSRLQQMNRALREEVREERMSNFRTESLVFSLVAANKQLSERLSALEKGQRPQGSASETAQQLVNAQSLNAELLEYLEATFQRFHSFVDQVESQAQPGTIQWAHPAPPEYSPRDPTGQVAARVNELFTITDEDKDDTEHPPHSGDDTSARVYSDNESHGRITAHDGVPVSHPPNSRVTNARASAACKDTSRSPEPVPRAPLSQLASLTMTAAGSATSPTGVTPLTSARSEPSRSGHSTSSDLIAEEPGLSEHDATATESGYGYEDESFESSSHGFAH